METRKRRQATVQVKIAKARVSRPDAREKAPDVAEAELWEQMQKANALEVAKTLETSRIPKPQARPKVQPKPRVSPQAAKPTAWKVRNLTEEKERNERAYDIKLLTTKFNKLKEQEEQAEQRLAILRLELSSLERIIGDQPREGQDWQALSEALASRVEQLQLELSCAEEQHRAIRERATHAQPGSEMMRSREDLQEAHEKLFQVKSQLEEAQRKEEAVQSLVRLQNERERLEKKKATRHPDLLCLGQRIQKFDDAMSEFLKMEAKAQRLPEVILHLKPTQELRAAKHFLWMKSVLGLLQPEWAVHFEGDQDGLTLPIKPFLSALDSCYPTAGKSVLLMLSNEKDGRYVVVHHATAEQVKQYARKPAKVPSCVRLLKSLMGLNNEVLLSQEVRSMLRRALQSQAIAIPRPLEVSLRKYQVEGFQWLANNAENGIGSLLADDMGLGKTLQCACLLQYLRDQGHISKAKPALVVVPFSVMRNWRSELQRWTPSLRARLYHGKHRSFAGDAEVLITTYAVLQLDHQKFCEGLRLSCMVLDESQMIKNRQSKTSKAAKSVAETSGSSCARVALTGTPLENRLEELFSLFEFLNPGFLGSKDDFAKHFEKPVQKGAADALERLREALRPFLLRRLKSDKAIAPELPEKVEFEHLVEMTQEQAELYRLWTDRILSKIAEGSERQHAVLALLHRSQQVANHPAALPKDDQPPKLLRTASESGKTLKLLELVGDILESQQKVLIFTQYLGTLQLLQEILQASFANLRPILFHGSLDSDARARAIKDFESEAACGVMLLTLKAGGVGLNLTAASHVIHFDRCWNPAKEAQATDRAHRIGQRSTVLVHRLTTVETFEERLARTMASKRALAASTIEPSGDLESPNVHKVISTLSDAQLRELFSLTPP